MSVVDKLKDWAKANITHLKWGSAGAVGLVILLLIAQEISPPLALAVAGPFIGWVVERYQAVRKEGVPSVVDMVATAAPFEAAALAWWALT